MFSKACEYAIKAMIYVNAYGSPDRKIRLNKIAAEISSPLAFTVKILQQLKKKGLLVSAIGFKGGFQIRKGKKIILKEIVTAIDGDSLFSKCILGFKACSSKRSFPLHSKYEDIKRDLQKMIRETALEEFSKSIKNKSILLKL